MKKYVPYAVVVALGCASTPPPPAPAPVEAAPAPVEAPPPAAAPAPAPAPEPAAPDAGKWRVSLISVKTEAKAERLRSHFAGKGYRAEVETVELEGTTWRRVIFPGYATLTAARETLAKLEQESGIQGGWIPAPREVEP